MIRDDIENLKFNELTDLEQREYIAILTLNARKLILQLMNSGDTQLATLISICLSLATTSPNKLFDLFQYASKLHEIMLVESETLRKNEQFVAEKKAEKEKSADGFPPLDTEKEN